MDEIDTIVRLSHKVNLLSHTNREKDQTIAALRAEVERLKKREEAWIDLSRENNEHYDELNKLCDTFGPNTEGDTYHGFLSKHITQLREDRRVLANECEAWRLASRAARAEWEDKQ